MAKLPQALEEAVNEIESAKDLKSYLSDPQNRGAAEKWKAAFHNDDPNFDPNDLSQKDKGRLFVAVQRLHDAGIQVKMPEKIEASDVLESKEVQTPAEEEKKEFAAPTIESVEQADEVLADLQKQVGKLHGDHYDAVKTAFNVLFIECKRLDNKKEPEKTLERKKDFLVGVAKLIHHLNTNPNEHVAVTIGTAIDLLTDIARDQNKYSVAGKQTNKLLQGIINTVSGHKEYETPRGEKVKIQTDSGEHIMNAVSSLTENLETLTRKHIGSISQKQ
ncbi:MAG: hypothetical protein SFW66_01005 [Gammaproteobacteria bacterium]|nr:hypothetical protein [Gammaproteobacteria bacterium]